MKRNSWMLPGVVSLVMAFAFLISNSALALKVGQKVNTVKVKDAKDKPAWIPDFGKKVITLFYSDPDVKDMNEPFRELLKAAKLDKKHYRGLGVVNMKDTWKPNFAIRSVIRSKIKKFKATILTDPDYTLKKKWKLGECNEKDVVIIIGKDKKVYYVKKDRMSKAAQKKALKLIKELMAK